jgi:hypothetical protein
MPVDRPSAKSSSSSSSPRIDDRRTCRFEVASRSFWTEIARRRDQKTISLAETRKRLGV